VDLDPDVLDQSLCAYYSDLWREVPLVHSMLPHHTTALHVMLAKVTRRFVSPQDAWLLLRTLAIVESFAFQVRTDYPPLSPADNTQIIVVTATVSSELQEKVKKIVPVSMILLLAMLSIVVLVYRALEWSQQRVCIKSYQTLSKSS